MIEHALKRQRTAFWMQPILDGIISSDGNVKQSIDIFLQKFDTIVEEQNEIYNQHIVDDLLDDIEAGEEIEEAFAA